MSDRKEHTKIDGIDIELCLFSEYGEARSECYLSQGARSASLECADACGGFEDDCGNVVYTIKPGTMARIRAWAESKGY